MKTTMTIYRVGMEPETIETVLDPEPGYDVLKQLLRPHLDGGLMEHVSVLHDGKRTDMFVDEDGHGKGLPRNEAATAIYRANALIHTPDADPETIPWIAGPAVLFSRRVWF